MGASDASRVATPDVDVDGVGDEEEENAGGGSVEGVVGDASGGGSSMTWVVVWIGWEGALEPVKSRESSSSSMKKVVR